VLCYGYWIREKDRMGPETLWHCRIDLGVAYACTAFFGIAVVIIGSTVEVEGKGAGLIVSLAEKLEGPLGPVGRWTFLVGAWGAMFLPMLALALLIPNGRTEWIGERLRNRTLTRAVLVAIVLFFAVAMWFQLLKMLSSSW